MRGEEVRQLLARQFGVDYIPNGVYELLKRLNPAEQLWQQLRERSLANRCYHSYNDIVDAC